MRFTLPNNSRASSAGFTLIEMLVISPIVILAIGGFVALMVSMVGDVLITRDRSAMTYNTQSALDQIEQDVRLATQFLTTTDDLETPQGSNNNFTGNAPFTNSAGSLILSAVTTDENPTSEYRWLVYYANQPNPCGDTQSYNRVFLMKVVYFIKDGSLWRRSIVPDYNTNTATPDASTVCAFYGNVWQRNSCSPGYSTSTRCQTDDSLILENVESFNIEYFAEPDDINPVAASQAESARTIEVTINGKKMTVGEEVTTSGSVRVTRLNNIDSSIPPPTTPSLSYTLAGPASAKFSWNNIPTANSYEISYNINGGSWTNLSLDPDIRTYTVDAERNDTITFKVAAKNASGTSEYATIGATMPAWTDLDLQNGWVKYSSSYSSPSFTRSSSGRVFLRGLIKDGGTAANTVIATLPPGYRPSGRLVFPTSTTPNVNARVDVEADGDIVIYRGASGWLSLDGISFLPSGTPYTWNTMPFENGWSNWDAGYEQVHATKDNLGRVNLQGLAKAGTTTSNTIMARTNTISTSYVPPKSLHFPAGGSSMSLYWIWYTGGEITKRGAQTSSYMGLQTLWYPGTTGTWTSITPQNSWVNYGGNYPTLQCTRAADDVVTVRGLVQNGTVTGGTIIARLPSHCQPAETLLMDTTSSDDYGRFDIQTDGDIVFRAGSSGWFALNVSFMGD